MALTWFSNLSARAVDVFLTNKNIHIFTSRPLPAGALRVLSYGLKFVPTLCCPDKAIFLRDLDLFFSSVRRSFIFDNTDKMPEAARFRVRSAIRKTDEFCVERFCQCTAQALMNAWDSCAINRPRFSTNTLTGDLLSLSMLARDLSFFISPTDKNLGVGIFDTDVIFGLLRTHLSCGAYRRFNSYAHACAFRDEAIHCLSVFAPRFGEDGKLWEFISQSFHPSTVVFPAMYPLPKIHKIKLDVRPICPSMRSALHHASIWMSYYLNQVVFTLPSICSGTKSLVQALEMLRTDTSQISFITADVESLYPSIDTTIGLAVLRIVLVKYSRFSTTFISLLMDVLEIILRFNIFEFDGDFFLQTRGTAMGTPVAPAYANLFLFGLEADFFLDYSGIIFFRRYIDDLFFIVSRISVEYVVNTLNNLCPGLSFTYSISDYKAVFLDLIISKGSRFVDDGRFDVCTFQKAANSYFYIPWFSAHPRHLKAGFVKGELLRYVRNCSFFHQYLDLRQLFYNRLRARGYPRAFLRFVFHQVNHSTRPQLLDLNHSQPRTDRAPPLFLGAQMSPFTAMLDLRSIVHSWWGLVEDAKPRLKKKPIIIFHKGRTILDIVRVSRKRKLATLST